MCIPAGVMRHPLGSVTAPVESVTLGRRRSRPRLAATARPMADSSARSRIIRERFINTDLADHSIRLALQENVGFRQLILFWRDMIRPWIKGWRARDLRAVAGRVAMAADPGHGRQPGGCAAERGSRCLLRVARNCRGRPIAGTSMAELLRLSRARAELLPAFGLHAGVDAQWPTHSAGARDRGASEAGGQ